MVGMRCSFRRVLDKYSTQNAYFVKSLRGTAADERRQAVLERLDLGDPSLEAPAADGASLERVEIAAEDADDRLVVVLHQHEQVATAGRGVAVHLDQRLDDHVLVPELGRARVAGDERAECVAPLDQAARLVHDAAADLEDSVLR